MPGNISQFLADIEKRGIAKTSHFDVKFSLPPVLLPDTGTPPILTMRCESAELPGRQIGTTDNRIYGPIYKTPYDSIYSEMTMTFVDTSDMSIRWFFETWMDQIFDSETNNIQYVDNIVSEIRVTQYDIKGTPDSLNEILAFRLIRAFPINVNQLAVTWGDDAPQKLSVTFFYERYVVLQGANPSFSTIETIASIGNGPNQEGLGREIIADAQVRAALQNAQAEANKSARKDIGLFGDVIQSIANKVKGL